MITNIFRTYKTNYLRTKKCFRNVAHRGVSEGSGVTSGVGEARRKEQRPAATAEFRGHTGHNRQTGEQAR